MICDLGRAPSVVANELNIKVDTVRNIARQYRSTGQIDAKQRGGSNNATKLNDSMKSFIKNLVDADCTITLEDLRERLQTAWNITVSMSTISKVLLGFHYTFKRLHALPERAITEELQQRRHSYAAYISNILVSKERFFFVDETGFQVCMRSFYGRSPANQRAVKLTTAVRSKNYSVIACMGMNSVFYFTVNSGGINGEAFQTYMTELLNFITNDDHSSAYVFMDNAPIHRVASIETLFNNNPQVNLVYLPPYTPQLNPIEHLFSQWKGMVRRSCPTTEQQLSSAIHQAAGTISEANCHNYYLKMEGNIFKLLANQSLDD